MDKLKYFLWGILAAAAALVLQIIFSIFFENGAPWDASQRQIGLLPAVFVFWEEALKFVFIKKIILEKFGKISDTVFLGLGFSFLEASLVIFGQSAREKFDWIFPGLLGIFLIHTATSALAGKLLLKRSLTRDFSKEHFFIFLIVFCLHFLYNVVIIKMS